MTLGDIMVGYPRRGTTDIIARLIRQWVAEWRDHPSIIEDHVDAGSNAVAATAGMGEQLAFPPKQFAFSPAQSSVIEFLRSWAHQRLVGRGI